MEPYWDLIERIVKEADLVLEILDARLISLSRNDRVEELIKEHDKPVIFVINKSDLIFKKMLKKQMVDFREEIKGYKGEVVFVSSRNNRTMKILLYNIKKVFKQYGKTKLEKEDKSQHRIAKGGIVVGVLGYPNVGKSSIINALAHKSKTKVSKKPGTTHGIHWIKATKDIKLIDSPGVIPLRKEDELRYGLIGARDSEQLQNPTAIAQGLIKLFLKENKNKLEEFYKIEIKSDDVDTIVNMISQKKGHLLKGGIPDENRTHIAIVRDWQHGKLKL